MRFARLATEVFHNEDYQFEIGKAEVIRAGSDVSIIACGLMVPRLWLPQSSWPPRAFLPR